MRKQGDRILMKALLAGLIISMFSVLQVQASGQTVEYDAPVEVAGRDSVWVVGLGVAAVPDYEGSEDYKGVPVPLIKYVNPNGIYVQLVATTLMANLIPSPTFKFGPLLRFRAERDDVESDVIDRMKKVEATAEFGAFAGVSFNNWDFKLEVSGDTSDGDVKPDKKEGHGGTLASLTGGYTFKFNKKFQLALKLFGTYASDEYMETYFGVDLNDSASSGLPVYKAEGGLKDAGATVIANYRFSDSWGVLFGGRATSLLGDASDSPVVDIEGSDTQALTFGVLTYTF